MVEVEIIPAKKNPVPIRGKQMFFIAGLNPTPQHIKLRHQIPKHYSITLKQDSIVLFIINNNIKWMCTVPRRPASGPEHVDCLALMRKQKHENKNIITCTKNTMHTHIKIMLSEDICGGKQGTWLRIVEMRCLRC